MFAFVLYYLIGPLCIIYAVQWFFKKYVRQEQPDFIRRLYKSHPVQPKAFRVVRVDPGKTSEPFLVGDFETHMEAVDAAYSGRGQMQRDDPGRRVSFFVLNDKGDFLEEVET